MANPYFSPLRRALEAMLQERAPAAQWLGTLRNARGVKEAEIADSGLHNFLNSRGNTPITRNDIFDHLDDEGVDLDEVLLGGPPNARVSNVGESSREYDYPDRNAALRQLEEDHSDSITEQASNATYEAEDERYHEHERPNWEIWNHHPFHEGPQEPTDIIHPHPDQGELFDGMPASAPHIAPNVRHEDARYYIVDPNRKYHFVTDPSTGVMRRANNPVYERGALPEDFESDAGPFDSEEEAQTVMEELRDRHRDNYMEGIYATDTYHRAYRDAVNSHANRYLDDYDFPHEDNADEHGPQYQQFSVPGGKDYGELVIRHDDVGVDNDRGYPSHFAGIDNIGENALAHVRFKTRTDADGKPILVIEEVQSDLHQRGREGGYRSDGREQTRLNMEKLAAFNAMRDVQEHFAEYARQQPDLARSLLPSNEQRYFDELPYQMMAAKQLIHHPSTPEGIRAEMQTAHARVVKAVAAHNEADTAYHVAKSGMPNAPLKNNLWAETAMRRMIRYAADHGFDRLAWMPGSVKNGTINHNGQAHGGEFYDQILPNIVNKMVKKHGGRTRRLDVSIQTPIGNTSTISAHAIDITPALADEMSKGVSIYSGIDPTKAKTTREALAAMLQAGGYSALLGSIATALERHDRERRVTQR